MITKFCNQKQSCCQVTYCPLVPAWATTIHKFQGFEAGFDKNDQFKKQELIFLQSNKDSKDDSNNESKMLFDTAFTKASWLVHPFIMRPPNQETLEGRAAYWSQASYSEESLVCGLIWYIYVSLLHSGHLPDNISLELMKAQHPLMPFIYSEVV